MPSFNGKGFIPSSLTSMIIIAMIMIYVEFATCDPLREKEVDKRSYSYSFSEGTGSHSDANSNSGPGGYSWSWSTGPDHGPAKSRQKRFCLLIFWLCTGGGGGGGGVGGGSGGSGGLFGGGAPGAPGGRI